MDRLMDRDLQKKLRIRRKFRQIVRQVCKNLYWLLDSDAMELGENVRQNVTLIYSGKKKIKPTLTLEQKYMLRKHPKYRTEAELNTLFSAIGGLKCFRQWPDYVKFKLVSCTYFVYYPAGRTIVKQNREAEALYFVIAGSVNVEKEYYDEVLNTWSVTELGTLGPGTMFGEVSLLKKIPRTATIITASPCELIKVNKEDYDETIHSTLKEQWDAIKAGLNKFPYLRLSDSSQTECCVLSKIKTFKANEIVYNGYKPKKTSYGYFILEGIVRVLEIINIEVNTIRGKNYYNIYDPLGTPSSSTESFESFLTDISESERKLEENTSMDVYVDDKHVRHTRFVIPPCDPKIEMIKREMHDWCPGVKGLLTNLGKVRRRSTLYANRKSIIRLLQLPENVDTHFFEICQFKESACFFDNEIFTDRLIYSLSDNVSVLMIPHYWLTRHNRGNIWERINLWLKRKIPTTNQVFKQYCEDAKWRDFKTKMNCDLRAQKSFPNDTAWFDIPYSLRIKERC